MRLPPLLVVAMRLLRVLVFGIACVVLVDTVVVADAASSLDVVIVYVAIAFGNVVVDVVARATAFLASSRSNLSCTAFELVRVQRTMM